MSKNITFNDVGVGRKFKSPSGIIFKKTSHILCIPVTDIKNKEIVDGEPTVSFYNTKILLTLV